MVVPADGPAYVSAAGALDRASRRDAPRRFDDRSQAPSSAPATGWSFVPTFPFDPGRTYYVSVLRGDSTDWHEVSLPATQHAATTRVTTVLPTDTVPENLLRMYIEFSAPMSRESRCRTHPPARLGGTRSRARVPAARRRLLESGAHTLHAVLRSGPSEARDSAERARWGSRSRCARAGRTRWRSIRPGAMRTVSRSRSRSAKGCARDRRYCRRSPFRTGAFRRRAPGRWIRWS